MSVTSVVKPANKGMSIITITPLKFIRFQDHAIEEKRLNLALDLRRF